MYATNVASHHFPNQTAISKEKHNGSVKTLVNSRLRHFSFVHCRLSVGFDFRTHIVCSRIRTWRNLLQAITTFLCSGCLPPTKHFHFAVQIQQSEDFCLFAIDWAFDACFCVCSEQLSSIETFEFQRHELLLLDTLPFVCWFFPRTHETGNKEYAADWVLTVRLFAGTKYPFVFRLQKLQFRIHSTQLTRNVNHLRNVNHSTE